VKETPLTTDFAAVGRLSVGLRAAPVRYPSRRKKEDQDLREPRQNLRESRQNSRQTGHGLKESNEDFPMCGQALAESEARFRLLVECVADYAIYMLDPKGQVVTWNEGAERSKGYKAEEIQGKNYSIFFLPEDAKAGLPTRELMAAARDGRYETEAWRRRKDSTKFWALVTLTAIRGPEGELRGFAKVTRDMTAQKASEEVLRRQNAELERYRIIVENIVDYVIFTLDAEGRIDSWSPGARNVLGYSAEEALGREYSLVFTPEEIESGEPQKEMAEAARNGHCTTDDWRVRRDGRIIWVSGALTAVRDETGKPTGYIRVARDMTAQKRLEEARRGMTADLEIRVAERTRELEVLLREVYHRVKNNLQVIQSLLKMRARLLPEGETRAAIDSTVQRIFAMSLAHEHLYRMQDLAHLSLSEYLRDLFNGVEASNSVQPGQIRLQLDAEEILLNLDHAIPFGLLANELLSNSFKHGFPEGKKGTIKLSVHRVEGVVRMVVSDDGIGLPEDFDAAKGVSMGLKLAVSLAHQLGGSLEFSSGKGCRVQADLTRL
jgi:PAS domain S-box-containing protein